MSKEIDKLAKAIENKGCKVTFGLQSHHIDVIEKHIGKFEGAKYSHQIWIDIGREIGWDSLTAAMYYFRMIDKQSQTALLLSLKSDIEKILKQNDKTIQCDKSDGIGIGYNQILTLIDFKLSEVSK